MIKDLIVDTVEAVVSGYRKILAHTVVPPYKMSALREHLKTNAGSLLFATVLLVFARALAGNDTNVLDALLVNVGIALLSLFLLFLIPTIVLLIRKAELECPASGQISSSEILVDKVSSVAIFIWLVSLTLFICDHVLALVTNDISIVNFFGAAGPAMPILTVTAYTALAVAVLFLRSWYSVKELSGSDWLYTLLTVGTLGVANIALMYFLIYKLQLK